MSFRTRAQAAAHDSWAKTPDRTARTEPARQAILDRLEQEVDPDDVVSPGDRRKAAENARKAQLLWASQRSADARAARKAELQRQQDEAILSAAGLSAIGPTSTGHSTSDTHRPSAVPGQITKRASA